MPKVTKKVVKKVVKKVAKESVEKPTYNEYGVCISCQGGDPDCHHTNLGDDKGKITCLTCGKCLSA